MVLFFPINSLIFSFLWLLALSKIISLFLYLFVICVSKKSTNLSVLIPPFSYKSQPNTPLVEIAKTPVYFLKLLEIGF